METRRVNRVSPDVWARLLETQPTGETLTVRRAAPELTERMFAAIDSIGQRHYLIRLSNEDQPLDDSQSRGLSVRARELRLPDGSLGVYLDLTCADAGGHDAFDVIGAELASELAKDGSVPAKVVSRVLAKWRRFWGQAPRDLLQVEEQLGLFAELWFLRWWLYPATDVRTIAARWRGPFAARHDIEWPGNAIEIKATTIQRGPVFRIHGLDQLEAPVGGTLHLFGVCLREENSSTHSVPSLIAELSALMAEEPEAITSFEHTLAQSGYSQVYESEYDRLRLRVTSSRLYVVSDSFPRLTQESLVVGLPTSISNVAYTLDLTGYDGVTYETAQDSVSVLRS